jgi:hypothetical protein
MKYYYKDMFEERQLEFESKEEAIEYIDNTTVTIHVHGRESHTMPAALFELQDDQEWKLVWTTIKNPEAYTGAKNEN